MAKIELKAGEKIVICFEGTDGEITVDYDSGGNQRLSVYADMPDTLGREGLIYLEDFSSEETDTKGFDQIMKGLEEAREYVKNRSVDDLVEAIKTIETRGYETYIANITEMLGLGIEQEDFLTVHHLITEAIRAEKIHYGSAGEYHIGKQIR